jgi:hypothetical protein
MDTLVDRILLRPLFTGDAALQSKAEVLRVGDLLGVFPTLEEMEENQLSDLPQRVQEAVRQLLPFQVEGHLDGSADLAERLLRVLNHGEVYVASFSMRGSYFSATGFRTTTVQDYFTVNLEEVLGASAPAAVVGTLVVTWPRDSQPLQTLRENLELAGAHIDPMWRGSYRVEVTPSHLRFELYEIQGRASEVLNYLTHNSHWHNVRSFSSVPAANLDFLAPYLLTQITPLKLTLRCAVVTGTQYVLQYYGDARSREQWPLYDQLVTRALEPLLSSSGLLRYYAVGDNPLDQVFLKLEDLIAAPNSSLVAPSDRALQRHYARIQDYDEAQALQQVLLRRQEFLSQRRITHTLRQRWPVAHRNLALHVLGHYWRKLRLTDEMALTLEGEMVTVSGQFLLLSDALATYILLLQAQTHAQSPNLLPYLTWLRRLEGDSLPHELVTYLDQAPAADASCQAKPPVAPESHPSVVHLPYQHYDEEDLQTKGDVVTLHCWQAGREQLVSSLCSSESYTLAELVPTTSPPSKSPPRLPTTVVNSQDYKLDITVRGEYYRCDVVAIPNDKVVDRWTLTWVPMWVELELPQLLERILWQWKRGHCLTPLAREWYHLTRQLWGVESTATSYQSLSPDYWQTLTYEETLAAVKRVFLAP